jgi:hypothetical protein
LKRLLVGEDLVAGGANVDVRERYGAAVLLKVAPWDLLPIR